MENEVCVFEDAKEVYNKGYLSNYETNIICEADSR